MADLNKFLNSDMTAGDVSHSNAYGQAAGGGGAGGLSMDARQKRLNETRVIGAYRYSKLGNQGSALKAKAVSSDHGNTYDPSTGDFAAPGKPAGTEAEPAQRDSNRQQGGIKSAEAIDTASIAKRQSFSEPTPRNYNPYS